VKLVRFGPLGHEKPGVLDPTGVIRDLSGRVDDIAGANLSASALASMAKIDPNSLPAVSDRVRLGACVGKIGKFICVGMNFSEHAAESGGAVPPEPIIFFKATSAVCGPNDDVVKPRGSTKLDWEVELAVVIGKPIVYADEAEAEDAIAGYCVCNDVSERNFQMERCGQWAKGKGCDTFGPLGPWLVTKEEAGDVENLAMWLEVNGKRYQNGSTKTMVYKPAFLVSYISQFMSLQPGDVISTGTPAGVGLGQKPPLYLEVGDVMELGIEGLGSQRQTVAAAG
jgi:2,4-diketo-3-deoxy-L-fuconate hydrolase